MPWQKICTFVPCCGKLRDMLSDFPYYYNEATDDGIKIYRAGELYWTYKFCPFCAQSLIKESG